jgi:hypothetical protein
VGVDPALREAMRASEWSLRLRPYWIERPSSRRAEGVRPPPRVARGVVPSNEGATSGPSSFGASNRRTAQGPQGAAPVGIVRPCLRRGVASLLSERERHRRRHASPIDFASCGFVHL